MCFGPRKKRHSESSRRQSQRPVLDLAELSFTSTHSQDSEPREVILHNAGALRACELHLMCRQDAEGSLLHQARMGNAVTQMGEVPTISWEELKRKTSGPSQREQGGGDWTATIEVWQDLTYFKIYEAGNRIAESHNTAATAAAAGLAESLPQSKPAGQTASNDAVSRTQNVTEAGNLETEPTQRSNSDKTTQRTVVVEQKKAPLVRRKKSH